MRAVCGAFLDLSHPLQPTQVLYQRLCISFDACGRDAHPQRRGSGRLNLRPRASSRAESLRSLVGHPAEPRCWAPCASRCDRRRAHGALQRGRPRARRNPWAARSRGAARPPRPTPAGRRHLASAPDLRPGAPASPPHPERSSARHPDHGGSGARAALSARGIARSLQRAAGALQTRYAA